jgi:uncharacterized protein (TIGR02444 family)
LEAGLWEWAEAAYARPGAAQACLKLQDEHGQNVCLLLWAVWAGGLDAAQLAAGVRLARRWETDVVAPLRRVRRALKDEAAGIAREARLRLRAEIQAAELEAERALLEGLQALGSRAVGGAEALVALNAASAAWGEPAPQPTLADLAAALE